MAESHIGCYKTELIIPDGPWPDAAEVELATLEWIWWYNTERTHSGIDDLTPVQAEQVHADMLTRHATTTVMSAVVAR